MGGTSEEEVGDDDEGIQMIRSAFGQSGSMQPKGLRMAGLPEQTSMEQSTSGVSNQESQALKQMLAISILNGQISGAEANAVLSLLGMDKEKVLDSINSIRTLRSTKNIEKQMPQYYKEILNQAKQLGINVNTEALWQQLGNKISSPQTLKLFL